MKSEPAKGTITIQTEAPANFPKTGVFAVGGPVPPELRRFYSAVPLRGYWDQHPPTVASDGNVDSKRAPVS